MFLLSCLLFNKLDPNPGSLGSRLSPPPVPSQRCAGNVIPGAARLISETAQRVHTIGQKQKNDQHLRRVQALLSGRQAKGLTSGSLHPSPLALSLPFSYSHTQFPQPPFSFMPSEHGPGVASE